MALLLRCFLSCVVCVLVGAACVADTGASADADATPRAVSVGEAAAPAFQLDEPTTILSTQDMDRTGLMFPDGTLWFVPREGRDSFPYYIFASGGSSSGVGKSAHLPAGSYAFAGTLASLHPSQKRNGWPIFSLTAGRQQPSPDGADFDRDYAGGGPTYALAGLDNQVPSPKVCGRATVSGAASAAHRGVLLQIYHGEYHLLAPKGMPAYGGSGMAISCDGGATFEKIGQILAPHVSREEFLSAHSAGGLWADGTMIDADAQGKRDGGKSGFTDQRERYYYLLFTDHNSPDERYTGLSIARVRAEDLLNAVRQRRAPAFRKYYNPSGTLTFERDYFTESGIGGRSTPVLFTPGQYMNTPGVVYDAYLRKFLLFYQVNQKQIELRTSEDLISWSPPAVAFRLDSASSRRLYYPSVAGEGPDPQVLGRTFYLYFLVRDQTQGRFANPQLLREQVRVIPGTGADRRRRQSGGNERNQ